MYIRYNVRTFVSVGTNEMRYVVLGDPFNLLQVITTDNSS